MYLTIKSLDNRIHKRQIVQEKKWTKLDKIVLEKVWESETLYSYVKGKVRWYVFQWSTTHQVHYRFEYTTSTAIFHYFITETKNHTSR